MHRNVLALLLCLTLACSARAEPANGVGLQNSLGETTIAEHSATESLQDTSVRHGFDLKAILDLRTPSATNFIFDLRALSHVAWSNDEAMIAAYIAFASDISVWNTKSGSLVSHSTRTNILSPDIPIAFSKDGKLLITIAPSSNQLLPAVSLLNAASGKVIQDVPGPFPNAGWRENIARLAAFSTATQTLVAAFGFPGQESLIAYRIDKDDRLAVLATIGISEHFLTRLAFSPDGRLLAVGSAVGMVTIYETTSWKVVDTLSFFPETLTASGEGKNLVESLAFSPSGKLLAAGAGGINLNRHRPSSLRYGQRDPALAEEPFVSNALLSPVRIYNLEQHRFRPFDIHVKQPVSQLAWGEEDLLLLTADDGGLTQCILVGEQTKLTRLIEDRVTSFALSTNHHRIAVSANDRIAIYATDGK